MFRLTLIVGSCIAALLPASWRTPAALKEASQEGQALAEELGCGACHAGRPGPDVIRTRAPILGSTVRPLPAEYVFDYLADPVRVRPDIGLSRMPRFDLTAEERGSLALFLAGLDTPPADAPAVRESVARLGPDTRQQGEVLFDALNCAGCHEHPEYEGRRLTGELERFGPRLQEGWLREYLLDPKSVRPTGDPPGSGGRMPSFRLTDAEIDALVGFLSAAGGGIPEGSAFDPPPPTPFSSEKAQALLRQELPCLGCHRLGGEGGVIGPPLDGVGQRLKPEAIRAMIEDPAAAMPGTIMPKSILRDDRVDLLAAYLAHEGSAWVGSDRVPLTDTPAALQPGTTAALQPGTTAALQPGTTAALQPGTTAAMAPERPATGVEASTGDAEGRALYDRFCAHCHGTGGAGNGYNAPYLPVSPTTHADSAFMSTRPDDTLFDGIYAGGRILGRSHRMPAFGETLAPEEIRALVSYMRTLCRCRGPAWTRDPAG